MQRRGRHGVTATVRPVQQRPPAAAFALKDAAGGGVPYAVLMGDDAVTANYAITALPLTYLIDRHGRVAAVYSGMVDRANLEALVCAADDAPTRCDAVRNLHDIGTSEVRDPQLRLRIVAAMRVEE